MMRTYRIAWFGCTGTVVVLGIVSIALAASVLMTVALFATLAICTGILAGNLHLLEERPAPPVRRLTQRVLLHAMVAGSVGVACYGLVEMIGFAALPLIVIFAASSPPSVDLLGEWFRPSGSKEAPPAEVLVGDAESGIALLEWTDAELYAVWCATYVVPKRPDAVELTTVAQARQHMLAEFERRRPVGMAAWLRSGDGLAGEPPSFLLDDHRKA